MSNKVLKIKFTDPFSNTEVFKRIEFPENFENLKKWCKNFIEISESQQYEFIDESTNKKITNEDEYQLVKNQISTKVTKFILKIVKKDEPSNFNLLHSINNNINNDDNNNNNENKEINENTNNLNNEDFKNFESSESKKLFPESLKKNNNESENNEKENENNENNKNENNDNQNNINYDYNIYSYENINNNNNNNNFDNNNENNNNENNNNNIEEEIDNVNSKIKESITLLVKEKMKKFEDDLIEEIYKNVSLNSSKLIEQSKINSSLSLINNNNNNNNNLAIHNNKCSICNEIIKGELFKCSKCKDFYLCSNCEEFNNHDENHIFIKIRNPKDDKIELKEIPQYKI
jgi:hypothetical protein